MEKYRRIVNGRSAVSLWARSKCSAASFVTP